MGAGVPPNQSTKHLSSLYEPHRSRIHAVTETGWTGTVIEDVTEVSVALAAGDRRSLHPQAHVAYLDDVLLGNGLPEARPARTGFKFRLRAEDGVIAADAAIKTMVVVIPGAAGIGALCTRTPSYFE